MESNETGLLSLRYHLENNAPVDLMEFTEALQALHHEYTYYCKQQGEAQSRARLNIHKVEEGSIIFELIEAARPIVRDTLSVLGGVNTLLDFWTYFHGMCTGLVYGRSIPSDGRNIKSLDNFHKFIQPLASNPDSRMQVSIIERIECNAPVTFNDCIFGLNSTEGNALQNKVSTIKEEIKNEAIQTEIMQERVILRLMQINQEQDSPKDRGIIEAFDPTKHKKLLFDDEDIKREFIEGEENFFKYLYYVDATAMLDNGRIVAYRITRLHEKFIPE